MLKKIFTTFGAPLSLLISATVGLADNYTHYPSLSPQGLLVPRDMNRRSYEEEAHRREMIISEDCPLILFFSADFAGEATEEQRQSTPSNCKQNFQEWRNAMTDIEQEGLIAKEEKREMEYEENFDDTARGRVQIDADGLAWLKENVPQEVISGPVTYTVVEENGFRWSLYDEKTETITIPSYERKSLLLQYSDDHSLRRYKRSVGRSLASEIPEITGAK